MSDFLLDVENWWSQTNRDVKFAEVILVHPSKTDTFVQQVQHGNNYTNIYTALLG